MEENREPLSAIAIEKKLQLLRNKHFSEDTIALVKSDYEYGLTEEEISLYLNKSYDIEQMKILSECLHKDVPKDVIDIIKERDHLSFQDAAGAFYHSKTYQALQNTENTLWAESAGYIADRFYEEQEQKELQTN